jgi:hypothetical protein
MVLDAVASYVGPYADDLTALAGTAHGILISLPHTYSACTSGEVGYGYFDVINETGGQVGNLCQEDLGSTLDTMIDSVLAKASPVSLPNVPISATIAVSRDDIAVPRSQSEGFSYHASSNSIVFHGMPFDPNDPADVVVSYRRWANQAPIE